MLCPFCNTSVPEGSSFCFNCGMQLPQQAVPMQNAPTQPTPVFSVPMPEAPQSPMDPPTPVVEHVAQVPLEPQIAYPTQQSTAEETRIPPSVAQPPMQPTFTPAMSQPPETVIPSASSDYSVPPAVQSTPCSPVYVAATERPPQPVPQKPKKSGGFLRVLPWILVGVLVVLIAVGGYFGYQEYMKMVDARDEYYLQACAEEDRIAQLESQVEDLQSENEELRSENLDLNDFYAYLSDIAYDFYDILLYADEYNIGGTRDFGVDPAVVYMTVDDENRYINLDTYLDGLTIMYDFYGESATMEFTEDSWYDNTQLCITAVEPGVTLFVLSTGDETIPEFGLLVIVTE